jgi:hypothetical protein
MYIHIYTYMYIGRRESRKRAKTEPVQSLPAAGKTGSTSSRYIWIYVCMDIYV